jgi:hypothetical protein
MTIGAEQLVELARNGGGASVNADECPATALVEVVRNMSKGTLIVRNASHLSQTQRLEIARNGPGRVLFEF